MDNLYKLDEYKETCWSGGKTKEFFIYPSDSSYTDRNFKIRFSEASVDVPGTDFTNLPGYNRFLIPITNTLVLEKEGTELPIKKYSTFTFSGRDNILSHSTGHDLNLMLSEDLTGKLEMVKFYNELLIKDEVKKSKILIFYSLDDGLTITSKKKEVTLYEGDVAIYISDDKFELRIKALQEENKIVWGKVTL
ncbi:MAG: HutD family protein [Ezakiella sp.]|nr:HutD family protein [Ezakiella sp.]MDD7471340.1 HutD family protein [Bacillota bacterium]MDY3923565.1 HutD family protein [Ezakiella sp.]